MVLINMNVPRQCREGSTKSRVFIGRWKGVMQDFIFCVQALRFSVRFGVPPTGCTRGLGLARGGPFESVAFMFWRSSYLAQHVLPLPVFVHPKRGRGWKL